MAPHKKVRTTNEWPEIEELVYYFSQIYKCHAAVCLQWLDCIVKQCCHHCYTSSAAIKVKELKEKACFKTHIWFILQLYTWM